MLLVKTTLKESKISGIGLYSQQLIKKDEVVWRFNPNFDLRLPIEKILQLTEQQQCDFFRYAYKLKLYDRYIYCIDNAKFMNHSDAANTTSTSYQCKAKRDIKPNEEITCNYAEFDANFIPFSNKVYSDKEWRRIQLRNLK